MAVPAGIINDIEARLGLKIAGAQALSGGDISQVYCLQTTRGRLVVKINSCNGFPDMFKKEATGLQVIGLTNTVAVPAVLLTGKLQLGSYLLMQWISPGFATTAAMQKFALQLAQMHGHSAAGFGFDDDNYMGALYQRNKWKPTWSSFFIEERLQPMLKMAVDKRELSKNDTDRFEELYKKLPGLFTEEKPALVHGDLWTGNFIISTDGKPYLIDPAVSYSNREFDIAMTTLFGGFSSSFYDAYNNAYPLQPGWKQRLALWNLYPLLVHVNLFGGGYAIQVRECVRRFS